MVRLKSAKAESSGGVVYRVERGQVEVVLVGRTVSDTWSLPKGTPIAGESREMTAERETREETGLVVRILEPIGSIHYFFVAQRTRYAKTVYYYLMEPTGGHLSHHDPEYDRVAWFPIDRALAVLTFQNDRDIVRKARGLIDRRHGMGVSTTARRSNEARRT